MNPFLTLLLLVASSAYASLQIDTSYDLPDGVHKNAKLFLVDKDVGEGNWITLPAGNRYTVKVQATQKDERVDLRFRVSEKTAGKEKLLSAPSIRAKLGHPAELRQGRSDGSVLFRVKATASEMNG